MIVSAIMLKNRNRKMMREFGVSLQLLSINDRLSDIDERVFKEEGNIGKRRLNNI